MEPYPLADGPPPRYAVESDDEDEYNPLSSRTGSDQSPEVTVKFKSIYDIPSKRPLVFASGEAGVSWATVANFGEQQGGIYVNDIQVGSLFLPAWTSAIIILSEAEARTRLPLFAMTKYTTAIIGCLQPTSVAILDSYPTQVYISSRFISRENAPIRYLSVGKIPILDSALELFAPPNLLQSTTASLLNQLFFRSISGDAAQDAIVLLPSPKVPSPLPTALDSKGSVGDFNDTDWDRETLEKAHKWLFAIVRQEVDETSLRARAKSATRSLASAGVPITRTALGEVGEGSMYI